MLSKHNVDQGSLYTGKMETIVLCWIVKKNQTLDKFI